jgi:hypothetical protein
MKCGGFGLDVEPGKGVYHGFFQFRMELADQVLEHVVRSSLVAQLNSLNRIEMHFAGREKPHIQQ